MAIKQISEQIDGAILACLREAGRPLVYGAIHVQCAGAIRAACGLRRVDMVDVLDSHLASLKRRGLIRFERKPVRGWIIAPTP